MCYVSPWLGLHFSSLSGRLSPWRQGLSGRAGCHWELDGSARAGEHLGIYHPRHRELVGAKRHCPAHGLSPRRQAGRRAGQRSPRPPLAGFVWLRPGPLLSGCHLSDAFLVLLLLVLCHRWPSSWFPRPGVSWLQAGCGQWEAPAGGKERSQAEPSVCLHWPSLKLLGFVRDSSSW